ncbi:uncharacterized protein LOC116336741 [Contarinia nasturtii]|uniref:uncharacterized protein LOC116336741 n=1 Tax=Contarinia nasturtii TaxID=265458 RepID=UPI0012D4BC63|nr:uncharacterized protein LOC116336741 [Contarinia nasturtii]
MTRCYILGALNLHYFTSDHFKRSTDEQIEAFYTQFVDNFFFRDWFYGVQFIEHAFNDARESGYRLCYGIWYYCQKYGVRAPVIGGFGNVVEYAVQMFYTNYKNNICMHAHSRIRKFFTHQNASKAQIDDTMDFLFKQNSNCVPDLDLMWELENTLKPIRFDDGKGYFFAMESNWFKYIPIFLNLQQYIRNHERERKAALKRGERTELREYRNFTVVPTSSFERHYIRIDRRVFYRMLRQIECPHRLFRNKNGGPKQEEDIKNKEWDVLWRLYFDIDSIEREPRNKNDGHATIKFDNSIQTDGVGMSFLMERTKFIIEKDDEERMKETQEMLLKSQQVYGLDPGLRLVIGGVRINNFNDRNNRTETIIRLTSGQYQDMINSSRRNKWRKKLTTEIDEKMRLHRESFDEQPGPRAEDHKSYADHILRHFEEKFTAYTQYEYALQAFLQYIDTNRALDAYATKLIDGKQTFIFVGDRFIAADSPARGYIRSKVRDLFEKLKRRRKCTVVEADEFRTTKLCSLCFRELEKPTKRGKVKEKYRYLTCHGCEPLCGENVLGKAQGPIESRKSNRKLTQQRKHRPRTDGPRMASKFRKYEEKTQIGRTITWNRDANAGRNILYKGWCAVMNIELHPAFQRNVEEEEENAGEGDPPPAPPARARQSRRAASNQNQQTTQRTLRSHLDQARSSRP